MRFFGSKDIKSYVKRFLFDNSDNLKGATVIDMPSGTGYTSDILKSLGARVEAYDLFPELFKVEGLECKKADMQAVLPIPDAHADYVMHQEGIEHIADQLFTLKEFNRILKPAGRLIITTPNYSNLRAKLSYLLNESEIYKLMGPNPIESIWFSTDEKADDRVYFGHMFLLGMLKLNLLATLAGFRVVKIHHTRVNITSLFLLILFYPLIVFSSWRAYRRAIRKNPQVDLNTRSEIFREAYKLQTNIKLLLDAHLFVEFEKVYELDELSEQLGNYHKHQGTNFVT